MSIACRLDHALFIDFNAKPGPGGDLKLTVCKGESLSGQNIVGQVAALIVVNAKALLLDEGVVANSVDLQAGGKGNREGVQVDMNVDLSGVLVVPAEMTVEEYLAKKAAEGNMVDVTPAALYPGHAPPQTIDHQPAPRPVPTGTTIAAFPGPRPRRGD